MKKLTVAVAIAGLFISGCSTPSPKDEVAGWTETEARSLCHKQVANRLKSPSTADFEGLTEFAAERTADSWKVSGHVDSQNSFGATIRTQYTCNVRPTSESEAMVTVDLHQ